MPSRLGRAHQDTGEGNLEIDLHIHTKHSRDCQSDPRKVIARAVELGLGAIAVTDHDNWNGARAARMLAPVNLLVVPGAELKTDHGDVLALFVDEEIRTRVYSEVVNEIRSRGGVSIVPHPCDSSKMRPEDIVVADGVEVFNSTCTEKSNACARELAVRLKKPGFASSDAHLVSEIGNGTTSVPDCSSVEELRKVILTNPSVSRAQRSDPLLHKVNEAIIFGLKGLWQR